MGTPFAFSLKAQRELTIHLYCDILNLQATTDLIVAYQPFKYRGYYFSNGSTTHELTSGLNKLGYTVKYDVDYMPTFMCVLFRLFLQ